MNKFRKTGRWGQQVGTLGVLITALYLRPEARAVVGYLNKVGPPALRIWQTSTNVFDYSSFELELAARAQAKSDVNSPTNQTGINATDTQTQHPSSENITTPEKTTPSENYSTGTSLDTSIGEPSGLKSAGNMNFPSTSASDLLTVTPQMIAQYLKPESNGTNTMDRPGTVVFVPADMPFMPPPVKTDTDSRASYHIK